jgi:hypothetical protein
MKFALGAGVLGALILSQACGSSDPKKRSEPTDEGGAAGARPVEELAGAPAAGGMGGDGGSVAAGAPAGGVAGEGEARAGVSCERAPTCTGDLSGLGTADFSVAFTITTTAMVGSGVISQRAMCGHSQFWDVRMRPAGALSVELDDNVSYTDLLAPVTVNDGNAHEVRVCRKATHLYVFADGQLVADAPNASSAFTTLAPLATSTTTCTVRDGTVTLVGSLSDVCVGAL